MQGVVPTLIDGIARHKFFMSRIRFTTKRKQEYNAAAEVLLIEFRGKFVDTKSECTWIGSSRSGKKSPSDDIRPSRAQG